MNIPIFLTLIRIVAIPVFAVIYVLPFHFAHPTAAVIFVLAAVTDWLDGYLARTLGQTTALGAFLDPVADKLLVAVALVFLLGSHYLSILTIPVAVIIGREIAVSALREWMAELGKRANVAVSFIGKLKTALQMLALILLIWYAPGQKLIILWLGVMLLYTSAVLTLWSMVIYLRAAWPDLTLSRER